MRSSPYSSRRRFISYCRPYKELFFLRYFSRKLRNTCMDKRPKIVQIKAIIQGSSCCSGAVLP